MQQRGTSTFGSDVHAGEPSVELDAMKMIIPARASESGRSHMRIWYLLASLELRDPSKVKNDRNFWRWAWRLKHTFETQSNQSLVDSKETQLEDPNAVTGATDQFCLIDENVVSEMFFFTRTEHPHHFRPNVRAHARRVGSTYAYDLCVWERMEVGLDGECDAYIRDLPQGSVATPANLFESKEL